jgi:hypothetical protein
MPTIKIQLKTKNYSHIGDPYSFNTDYVPRVGELLDMTHVLGNKMNSIFIVRSVISVLKENEGLVPHLVATEWYKGLRSEVLEEFGWLPQSPDTIKSYDEDQIFW